MVYDTGSGSIRGCACAYQGVRNVSFSEQFVYVLHELRELNFRIPFLSKIFLKSLHQFDSSIGVRWRTSKTKSFAIRVKYLEPLTIVTTFFI